MALKAYTLDLSLQTSSEFAIGNTIPNVEGIATDGAGFIPTKNSINKTITLSKGFGKFGGRLFEMTEQTVYSWDSGTTDADAYLVIDFTKQNSFTGTIEDGTYEFVDNQSSIVLSDTVPSPSANALVYKLDGNYQNSQNRSFNQIKVSGKGSFNNLSVSGPAELNITSHTLMRTSYGLSFVLTRLGSLVILDVYGTTSAQYTPSDNTYLITVPNGYTTSKSPQIINRRSNVMAGSKAVRMEDIYSDSVGAWRIFFSDTIPANTYVAGQMVWNTTDQLPV